MTALFRLSPPAFLFAIPGVCARARISMLCSGLNARTIQPRGSGGIALAVGMDCCVRDQDCPAFSRPLPYPCPARFEQTAWIWQSTPDRSIVAMRDYG
jgi:hypothetical protein